jgi:hypothetical protein
MDDPPIWNDDPEMHAKAEAERRKAKGERDWKPNGIGDGEEPPWGEPDMGVLRQHRRTAPPLPLNVFGPAWGPWITAAAEAAACPPDYVVAPLLATVSVLIGHARWSQATPGWAEPPHLWLAAVGDSGDGKSPGADPLTRDVLPAIEQKMRADFPDRLREWRASSEINKAAEERWKSEVRDAHKKGCRAPLPPDISDTQEPQSPRLRQHDVTIEKVASILAAAAPKGLLVWRDELAGWIDGMTAYNEAGRSFWVEAYGGRPYRVERQKHPDPIDIPRLAVGVYGGTQPDKLALLMREADDGLLSRMLWSWPDPIAFRLGHKTPAAEWAVRALDRLRELDLQPGIEPHDPPRPIMVPLATDALPLIEAFGRAMQEHKTGAGGLLRSALGKARGLALRLSLCIEMLWWCGEEGMAPPPPRISARAFAAATQLINDYFMLMAERVYGDAAATPNDRNAATLARWIMRTRPDEVHVPHVQRKVRLPGLKTADNIHAAAAVLVEADWLMPPPSGAGSAGRGRAVYTINPRVWEARL